ncbi:hypothetical protein BCAR13_560050 [Paraburkholderia caribensis]|nr:hypothetical protein BCAR13_560050 [Paraburkholderia caribensis]
MTWLYAHKPKHGMVNPEAFWKLCGGAADGRSSRIRPDSKEASGNRSMMSLLQTAGRWLTMGNSAPETTVVYAHKPRQH